MRISLVFITLSLFAAGAATAQNCPSLVWTPGQEIAVTGSIRDLQTIDYDSDGKLDLAGIIASNPDTLVTWRGLGDGTFSAATLLYTATTNIGGEISSIAIADVDGNGHPDLIVAIFNTLRVYPATGSGLGTPVDVQANYSLSRLTAGNFDSDPAVEVIASVTSYNKFLFFDNVSGGLVETASVQTGQWPGSIVSADFDGDGFFDVAMTQRSSEREGTVEVHFGASGGTYTAPVSLVAGEFPSRIATADFDGDGRPDLATSNWYDGNLTIFRYAGTRQFTSSSVSLNKPRTTVNAYAFLATDLTGDGKPDLVAPALNFGGWVTTWVGVGDGTFFSPSRLVRDSTSVALASGDFDGDGDADLAIGDYNKMVMATSICAVQVDATPESPMISSGADAVFEIRLSGFGTGSPTPHGTVALRQGAIEFGSASVDAAGNASITVSGLSVGEHTFTAHFSGNAALSAATSGSVLQKVTSETTQTVINTPGTQPVYGTPWPITVDVNGGWNGDEWVRLTIDGVVSDFYTTQTKDLLLSPGPHTISARFYGTNFRPASASAPLNINVAKATPSVALAAGATTVRLGSAHALQFSVNGPAAGAAPTGTVQLMSGTTVLGSAAVNGTINVTLPRGAHAVTAVYSGDANYTAASLNLTLDVLPNQPLVLEARALNSAIQIAYVLPEGTSAYELNRRTVGGAWQWLGTWDTNTGVDIHVTRGVIYEYQLEAVVNGVFTLSNIEGALVFTDDPIIVPTTRVKRAHFSELRDSINLMRTAAGLPAFQFDATFNNASIVRGAHVAALRTAVTEARNALGMTPPSFTWGAGAGSTIRAIDIEELRNLSR